MFQRFSTGHTLQAWLSAMTLCMLLPGCATPPQGSANAGDAAQAAVVTAPGDQSLQQGVLLYQAARYEAAETVLKTALQQGISQPQDVARAHKHLAFIYCTSKREALCSAAFKAARQADPGFELTKAEAGHPLWGPVYRRVMAATASR